MIFGVGAASLALQGFGGDSLGAREEGNGDHNPSLITQTPMEGRELAIKLSRRSIADIQTHPEIRKKLRVDYAMDTAQLIASAQVISVQFQIIAATNNYWK